VRFDLYIPKEWEEQFIKFKFKYGKSAGRILLWSVLRDE